MSKHRSLPRFLRANTLSSTLLVALLALTTSRLVSAQTTVGVQKFGAYSGFPDTVDLGTLGLHWEIPLFNKAGRGKGTAITFTLNNYMGYPAQQVVSPDQVWHYLNLGPGLSFGLTAAGSLNKTGFDHQCAALPGAGTYTDWVWTYVDDHGNSHLFPGASRTIMESNNTCASHNLSNTGLTAQASDGSGYLIQISAGNFTTAITTPSGTVYSQFSGNSGGATSVQDANGNTVTLPWGCPGISPCIDAYGNITSYTIKDTVNTSIQITGGGYSTDYTSRNPLLLAYIDDNGQSQTITLNYRMYAYQNGLSGGSTSGLLDSISYPDGSAYHFTYVQDSSGVVVSLAPVASMTLPTGGVISFTYPGGIGGCGLNNPPYIPSLTRTTSDGTTTYTRTITSGSGNCSIATSYTQVAKQNGDQTLVYFTVPQHLALSPISYRNPSPSWQPDTAKTFETKRLEYSHTNLSVPVRTTARCYNGASGDCTAQSVNEPVTQLAVTTTLDNGLASQVVTQYNALGSPTEVDEYDFGASTPTRKTITAYASLGNNISDRPSSTTVYDSSGVVAKQTTYSYAQPTPTSMTLPGHVSVSGDRGNPTSVYESIDHSGHTRLTQYAYDDAGQLTSVTDPNLHITSYGYDPSTDAYRTTITRPQTAGVTHVSTFSYGPNSGLMATTHNENQKLTTFVPDSMFRPSSVTYPDGGETTFSYTPTSRTTNVLQQTGVWMSTVEQLDGYGRLLHKIGADGNTTDYAYDSLGQLSSVSNPHGPTAQATDGSTSYQYDALGRVTAVTNHPDNSSKLTDYIGRAIRTKDENGVTRVFQSDAFGRVVSVCEGTQQTVAGNNNVPSLCNQDIQTTGFLTTYNYDVLGNLLQVSQAGLASRAFTYDLLSRLTQATNPESGMTSYGYDANGNVKTRVRPAPNQTNPAVTLTTTYTYDEIDRLTQTAYSDTATWWTYRYYDEASYLGVNLQNTVGRLSHTIAGDQYHSFDIYSYDNVGRVLYNYQNTPVLAGYSKLLSDTYDLAGNVVTETNGVGVTLTNSYDSASRLTAVTSSLVDANHPGTLFSNPQYYPIGAVAAANFGNGSVETLSYNPRGQLTSKSVSGYVNAPPTSGHGTVAISGALQVTPNAAGSVAINGAVQSKQVQTQAATAGTGTVNVNGAEQSVQVQTNGATQSTGNITITGSEQRVNPGDCPANHNPCYIYDGGTVSIAVNGWWLSANYGQGSSSSGIASALTNSINGTGGYPVTASVSGSTIYLTSRGTGSTVNYALNWSTSYDNGDFLNPSFGASLSGSTMTGGFAPTYTTVYDSGTVSITVNGFAKSVSYGQGSTGSSIASNLAAAFNGDGASPVTASVSGITVSLISKATGTASNYSLSDAQTYNTSYFGGASFTPAASGSTLSGGAAAQFGTLYDTGTVSITVNGFSKSVSYGQGASGTSMATALTNAFNGDTGSPVTASSSGITVSLGSKISGTGGNYSLASSQTYSTANFSSPSFSPAPSGSTLTGGSGSGIYDSGSVSVTVNGSAKTVAYGQADTPTTVASRLASAMNADSSFVVSASSSAGTLSMTAKQTGAVTNYSVSTSQTYDTSHFSSASFNENPSGAALTGGSDASTASATVYALSLGYGTNDNGNVLTASDTINGNWTYTYDDFNRLISSAQAGQAFSYSYDRYGNRWAQTATAGGGPQPNFSFDANNHIVGYNYDAAGNMLGDGVHSYTYDAENRIIAVDGGVVSYMYDADGKRIEKLLNNGNTYDFLYDTGGHEVTELNNGSWSRGEIFLADRHLATYSGGASGTTIFHHADWLGTNRVATSTSGMVSETCSNLPFGDGLNCIGTDLSTNHFTAKERDTESGLDDLGARYYASSLGRFLTADWSASTDPDPVPYADLHNPQSLNLYSYTKGNPTTLTDPNGHCSVDGEQHGWFWCALHTIGITETQKEQADGARANLAGVTNITINGQSMKAFLKTATDQQVLIAQRAVVDFLTDETPFPCGNNEVSCGIVFPGDFATKATFNWSASFQSEGEARAFALTKLGSDAVEVEPGKWRSADGKWQYRAKPGDTSENHVHLEQLNPRTGEVIQNLHLTWPEGTSR